MTTLAQDSVLGGAGGADHAAAVDVVAARLGSSTTSGLSAGTAGALLVEVGANRLDEQQTRGWLLILRAQVASPMIWLLAAAGVLSALLGDTTEAAVILGVVLLNTVIGFRQEYRAQTAMASLQRMTIPEAVVVRDGTTCAVAAHDLVPGDLVRIEAGSRVPADGRLVEAHALRVQESALTGESAAADKDAQRCRSARRWPSGRPWPTPARASPPGEARCSSPPRACGPSSAASPGCCSAPRPGGPPSSGGSTPWCGGSPCSWASSSRSSRRSEPCRASRSACSSSPR